jgi:hypothetical protein
MLTIRMIGCCVKNFLYVFTIPLCMDSSCVLILVKDHLSSQCDPNLTTLQTDLALVLTSGTLHNANTNGT